MSHLMGALMTAHLLHSSKQPTHLAAFPNNLDLQRHPNLDRWLAAEGVLQIMMSAACGGGVVGTRQSRHWCTQASCFLFYVLCIAEVTTVLDKWSLQMTLNFYHHSLGSIVSIRTLQVLPFNSHIQCTRVCNRLSGYSGYSDIRKNLSVRIVI